MMLGDNFRSTYVLVGSMYYKRESLDIGVCASICATPIYQLSCQEFERIQDTSWSTIAVVVVLQDISRRVIQCTFCLTLFVFQSVSQQPPYMNMSSTIKKKVTLRNINCRFEYLKEDRLDGETPSRKTKKEKSSTNSIKNSLWQLHC